jgi:hypothetical protein
VDSGPHITSFLLISTAVATARRDRLCRLTDESRRVQTFNELPVEALALGSTVLNQSVPNPFQGLISAGGLGAATVPRQQLLRPFPQFTSFNMADRNDGSVWYNSLQLSVEKRYSHGLTFIVAYTLSKNVEALSYLNGQDAAPGRTLTGWDRPHASRSPRL